MKDIFGKELHDFNIVAFPFITRGQYMNSKVSVHLSYGVLKGKRVYTIDKYGDIVYKVINSPETMLVKLVNDIPDDVYENIYKIRDFLENK